jgi:drug/metabolite transporter (DMT)-like permease
VIGAVLFGLLAAVSWGTADFCGGLAAKRTTVYSVIIVGNLVAFVVYTALALLFAEPILGWAQVVWGASAGLAGGVGLAALYHALASGQMSIAAPISAVIGASFPVVITMVTAGLPGGWQVLGFALALVGIWLVSSADGWASGLRPSWSIVGLPLLAGVGFGLFFVLIHRAGDAAIFAPIVHARWASTLLMLGLVWRGGQRLIPPRAVWPLAALSGLLDGGANVLFVVASQSGRLDVASILSSLYPAVTVLLAWLLLGERLSRTQLTGVLATLLAIGLIVA